MPTQKAVRSEQECTGVFRNRCWRTRAKTERRIKLQTYRAGMCVFIGVQERDK